MSDKYSIWDVKNRRFVTEETNPRDKFYVLEDLSVLVTTNDSGIEWVWDFMVDTTADPKNYIPKLKSPYKDSAGQIIHEDDYCVFIKNDKIERITIYNKDWYWGLLTRPERLGGIANKLKIITNLEDYLTEKENEKKEKKSLGQPRHYPIKRLSPPWAVL